MKKFITILIVLALLAGCVFGYFVYEKRDELKANQEIISQTDLFDVSGDEVAIIHNFSLQTEKGLCVGGKAFLPIDWVNDYLNDKFYWDSSANMLIYTLPEEILYFDGSQEAASSSPRFIMSDGQIFLAPDFIASHTAMSFTEFCGGEANRIFITDDFEPYNVSSIKKDTQLRTGESYQQRIITDLTEGQSVRVLKDDSGEWARVLTDSGFSGYVELKYLGEYQTVEQINTFTEPIYSHLLSDEKIIMVWHQTTNNESNAGVGELLDATSGVNVISPTWFSITDNNGNLSSIADETYVTTAHERGLKVWALVDNFSNSISSTSVLSNLNARTNIISQLVAEVTKYGIDGINVDFEQLEEACGPHFVEFIRELSVSCRLNHIVLSIDNPNAQLFSLYYGRGAQAECADYVINMGYDEHYAGGEAGSVASIGFEEEGLNLCLAEVPANQLISGIPFYTRIWTIKDAQVESSALGIANASEWINENHVALQWKEDLGQNYGHVKDSYIWMEDAESIALKVKLAKDKNLAGIAAWKLGFETPEIWGVISPY